VLARIDGWTMGTDRRTMGDGRAGAAAASAADNRGRPWHDTRAVLHGVLWVLARGHSGGTAGEVPSVPDLSSALSAVGAERPTGAALVVLARHLHQRGRLNLDEAFVECNLCECEKGGFAVAPPVAARRTKILAIAAGNSLPLAVLSIALRRPSASLWSRFLPESFLDEFAGAGLIGDKAYDSDPLDQKLAEDYDIELIAPNRRKRSKTQMDATTPLQACWRWRDSSLDAQLPSPRTRWEYHIDNFSASCGWPASTSCSDIYETASRPAP